MVLVKVFLLLGHGLVLVPGLWYEHQQGVVQVTSSHLEQFKGVVQAGRVAISGVSHRGDLGHVIAK